MLRAHGCRTGLAWVSADSTSVSLVRLDESSRAFYTESLAVFERDAMRVAKNDVDVRMQIPGAVIRQKLDFGDASGLGRMSGEYFSLAAGVDTTPLFQGLPDNACQCPHWGYVLRGQLTTTDAAGVRETVRADDLFYWPPGHNVRVDEDAEIIMFSPQKEHAHVIDHMLGKLGTPPA